MAAKAQDGGSEEGRVGRVPAPPLQPQPAAAAAPAADGAGAADAAAAAADLSGVSGAYPGDDAPKEQLAAWLGKEAEKRGLPPELPVMAALVESGVKNLNFGDADSVGFFQMRVGIWNQGEYAGYPEKPELQAKWFLDQAEAVKKQRIARGQSVDDPSQYGEWIADVERPAEQYRGRYQLRLDEAKGLLEKAAGSAPAAPAAAAAVDGRRRPGRPRRGRRRRRGGRRRAGRRTRRSTGSTARAASRRRRCRRCSRTRTSPSTTTGIADIKAGKIDPRVIAAMTKLSEDHKITVTCMCSDHSQLTAGGSISNHSLGRGLDIGDDRRRDRAPELGRGARAGRPSCRSCRRSTGRTRSAARSPISGPGYFTDAAHQDHIHFGFKQEISKDWRPPADVAAGGSARRARRRCGCGARRAGAAAPRRARGGAPPRRRRRRRPGDSGQFLAAGEGGAGGAQEGRLAARSWPCRPVGPASALADPAAVPGAVDAAAAAAPGSGSSTLGAAALKTARDPARRA